MQIDQLTRLWIPPDYVQSVKVSYGGTPVLEVEGDIALSADPAVSFSFVPTAPAPMVVQVEDSKGRKFEHPGRSAPPPSPPFFVAEGLLAGPDGRLRCAWAGNDPLYRAYHDERGRLTADDRYLFEKLCLEGFQSGLSWLTIPPEARELPPRLRRLRRRRPGRLRPHRRRAPARRCRHRPPPRQDRIGAEQRTAGDRAAGGGLARGFCAALHAGPGVAARAARLGHPAGAREYARIVRAEQGAAPPRLELRRPDDGVRVHAGGGNRERPPRRLLREEEVERLVRRGA